MTDVSLVGPRGHGWRRHRGRGPAPETELGITAHRAVMGKSKRPRAILGNPRVAMKGRTLGLAAHAFFELIDVAPDGTRVTVDDQTMPRSLEGGEFKSSFDLHGVSWLLKPGHKLELEITTGSTQYSIPRTGPYPVTFDNARVKLPLTHWPAHRHRGAP